MATVRYTLIDGEVIADKRGGVRNFYVPDALGSTTALLNTSQVQTDTFTYWPYGEGNVRTGTTPTPLQFVGTAGYYRDSAGRNYVRARYLDALKGRWLTNDPINDVRANQHAYCANNPSTFRDPSGQYKVVVTIGANGLGTISIIGEDGDNLPNGALGPTRPGLIMSGPASNIVRNLFVPPERSGGEGPIQSGTFPITGWIHRNERWDYGAGAIQMSGGVIRARGTWIHAGHQGRWYDQTHGCVRTTDAIIKCIVGMMSSNPGGRAEIYRETPLNLLKDYF